MMKQPKITSASASDHPLHLRVTFGDRSCAIIDLSELVAELAIFAPLEDPVVFAGVAVDEWGWSVRWSDQIDLGADTLWRLSLEQSGEAMSPKAFREWRHRNKLSQAAAATALGLGRRIIIYYEQGQKIIPKTIRLATLGYEAESGRHPTTSDTALLARFLEEMNRKPAPPLATAPETASQAPNVIDLEKHRTIQSRFS